MVKVLTTFFGTFSVWTLPARPLGITERRFGGFFAKTHGDM
jgi:hypothetical protein